MYSSFWRCPKRLQGALKIDILVLIGTAADTSAAIFCVFGLIGADGCRKREHILCWTLALVVLESLKVAVATGNQWTKIVIIVTRLLLSSRRD
jgi:hypothetical protein